MPVGRTDAVEIANGSTMIKVRAFVTVCTGPPLSVALTVNVDVPDAVGVPPIVPDGLSVNPACRLPLTIDHINGAVPPAAVRICE